MQTVDLGSENVVRLTAFILITMTMIVWERIAPAGRRALPQGQIWSTNFGMGALNAALLPIVMPLLAVEMAIRSQEWGWGLFEIVDVSPLIAGIAFVVAFDCTIYWQHRLLHLFGPLRRLHRVHHMDPEADVSTGVRFHPLSIVVSLLIKLALIAVLAPSPIAVIVAEILLNVSSMFNHGNVYIPSTWDRRLRWFSVTPRMHHTHHSIDPSTRNHNFGFDFSVWDRLFGSYIEPLPGEFAKGVPGFEGRESLRFCPR